MFDYIFPEEKHLKSSAEIIPFDDDKNYFSNTIKNFDSNDLNSENLTKNSNEIDFNQNENNLSSDDDNIKKEFKFISNTIFSTSSTENLNQNEQELFLLNDDDNNNINNNINNNNINNYNNYDNNNLNINSENKNNESQNSEIKDYLNIEYEINNSKNDNNKKLGKKKGRKKKNENENNENTNEYTRRFYCDDVGDVIKNNFHDFMINFLNINIIENFGRQIRLFRKIDPKIIDEQNPKDFFKQKIKDLLEKNISKKYTRISKEQNKENLDYLIKKEKTININYFKELSEKPVGYIYKNYFIKDNFHIDKKIEKINKKKQKKNQILCFEDFIKNLRIKNNSEIYIKRVKEIVQKILKVYEQNINLNENNNENKKILFYIKN
jgi:hypothetical protein